MSRLQQLIQELCPDGVKYVKLEDVCVFERGTSITKKDIIEGDIPVVAGGQEPAYYCNQANRTGETVVISSSGAYAGYVSYWNQPIFVSDAFTVKPNDFLLTKYLYYFLVSKQARIYSLQKGGGVPHVYSSDVALLKIPIPPISVQQEIVRILDTFTGLNKELNAELTARKKQYEHYRGLLFTFNYDVEWKTLGEISKSLCSGGTPLRTRSEYYDGDIPWLRTQEVQFNEITKTENYITDLGLKNSSAKWIPANCVIVAMYGATAANVAINKIPLTTNQACCNLEINDNIAHHKYVFYWLCNEYRKLKSLGRGSQSNINSEIIKNFKIPIPSIEEQQRIVNILDHFYKLIYDPHIGIPAEIEARKKQYEYYLNKLLDFKEVTS